MKKKTMSIRSELGLKFGTVVVILLAMGFIGISLFKQTAQRLNSIDEKSKLAMNTLYMRSNYDEMIVALKTMIIKAKDPKIFKKQLKIFNKKNSKLLKLKAQVLKNMQFVKSDLSKETLQYYNQFEDAYTKFYEKYTKALPYLKNGDSQSAVNILRGIGMQTIIPLEKFTRLTQVVADNERKELMQKANDLSSKALYGMIIVAIIAIIAVLTFMKRICNIVNQIKKLTEAANTISMGKEYPSLKADKYNELGDLTEAFERMRVSMFKAISKLKK